MTSTPQDDQALSHLNWLRSLGFNIETLIIGNWTKCLGKDEASPTGAFAYRTYANELNDGNIGLLTLAKVHGQDYKHQTLPTKGQSEDFFSRLSNSISFQQENTAEEDQKHQEASKKAYGFWQHSLSSGTSDYLTRKGVGSYSIKFRESEAYGKVAVIPMQDIESKLWSYQLLNPDGTKVFPPNSRTKGLFHTLAHLTDGAPFGIAESYVTAATCYELTGVPTVCAFTCHNLLTTATALNQKYPNSPIIFFADNDRHLDSNQGVLKAQEAIKAVKGRSVVAVPDFGDISPSKDATDWNDLLRLRGRDIVEGQFNLIRGRSMN